jgi:hypothetical protein
MRSTRLELKIGPRYFVNQDQLEGLWYHLKCLILAIIRNFRIKL